MLRLILTRLALTLPLVLGASFITFAILYFVPGDPVVMMLGDRANDQALVKKMRAELRLDEPFYLRYGRFLGGLAKGDFGRSYRTNRLISEDLKETLPATVELATAGLALSIFIGIASGLFSAMKQYSLVDYGFMLLALVGVSIPVFWLALMLSYFFAFKHPIFEMAGRISSDFMDYQPRTGLIVLDSIWDRDWPLLHNALMHLVLPATTLGLIGSALIARMTRSSILEVKTQDFVRTARAKGLAARQVLNHIVRNALLPVITVVGLQFGALLGGAIITEEIFAWPGIGTYLIQAIRYRDIVAVQGTVMVVVILFLGVNLVVDLLYAAVDPRTRVA
ncbi:MAG: ABC transporter permease [Candidatus Sumerlaeaceae bacterium]